VPFYCYDNFGKCRPVLIIISLLSKLWDKLELNLLHRQICCCITLHRLSVELYNITAESKVMQSCLVTVNAHQAPFLYVYVD